MSTFRIKRRTVLRGMLGGAGVSMGLPPLEAMFNANGTAHADGTALPRRLGIFFWGNGAKLDRWTPTATGANYPLSPELMPLEPVKDYVSVVSGMAIKTGNQQGHHAGTIGILSGSPMVVQPAAGAPFRSTFSAATVDQVAAKVLYTGKGLKSLEVGISTRVNGNEGTTLKTLSHNGPDMPNPAEYSATNVFNRLFGMGFTAPNAMPVTDVTKKLRRSVLDAVLVDINAVNARVSAFDKQRLDEHGSNIRNLENRLQNDTVLPAMCKPMGMPNNNVPLEPRLKLLAAAGNVAFDVGRFSWIGTPVQEPHVFWVWHTAPAKSFADLRVNRIIMGATAASADNYTLSSLMNQTFGTRMELVTGYQGQNEINLAVERGEVQGNTTGLTNLIVTKADWIKQGRIRMLLQFGSERAAEIPDVPAVVELASSQEDREIWQLFTAKFKMARPLALPPDVPRERVQALRDAFDATMQDPLFRADAQKIGLELSPLGGEAIDRLIGQIQATPEPVVERLRKLLAGR